MPISSYKLDEKTLKGQIPATTGQVIFVNSNTGNSTGDGTSLHPFDTLENALNKSGLSSGDTIVLMEGHAETISGAAGAAIDVAGVSIIGMGVGNKRPTFSFSATASTITMTAANCSLKNVICKATIDAVVSAIVVSAAGCTIDIESQDTSSAVEFAGVILTTSAADNITIKHKHIGFTAGDAMVSTIVLIGVDGARLDVDYYGKASTAFVEMKTTACTNVVVKGYMYNNSVATGLKNVVDTQGSSVWSMDIRDGVTGANQLFGSAGNGVYDPLLGYRVTKVSNLADGSGTDNLFTVNGRCLITSLTGEVTTVIGGAATMKLTDTTNSVDLCAATTIDTDAVGTMYALPGLSAQILNGTGGTPVVGSVPNVTTPSSGARQIIGGAQAAITIAHILDAADTGAVTWSLWYKPLVAGATIVAAA